LTSTLHDDSNTLLKIEPTYILQHSLLTREVFIIYKNNGRSQTIWTMNSLVIIIIIIIIIIFFILLTNTLHDDSNTLMKIEPSYILQHSLLTREVFIIYKYNGRSQTIWKMKSLGTVMPWTRFLTRAIYPLVSQQFRHCNATY